MEQDVGRKRSQCADDHQADAVALSRFGDQEVIAQTDNAGRQQARKNVSVIPEPHQTESSEPGSSDWRAHGQQQTTRDTT
jgi:hypothetical protein